MSHHSRSAGVSGRLVYWGLNLKAQRLLRLENKTHTHTVSSLTRCVTDNGLCLVWTARVEEIGSHTHCEYLEAVAAERPDNNQPHWQAEGQSELIICCRFSFNRLSDGALSCFHLTPLSDTWRHASEWLTGLCVCLHWCGLGKWVYECVRHRAGSRVAKGHSGRTEVNIQSVNGRMHWRNLSWSQTIRWYCSRRIWKLIFRQYRWVSYSDPYKKWHWWN